MDKEIPPAGQEKEDDIFSDASSVNLSKLPKSGIIDSSSEEDEEIFAKSFKKRPGQFKKEKTTKASTHSSSSSPIPHSITSSRSSHSSIVSSPPQSKRGSCSSKAEPLCEKTPDTPPTVKKNTVSKTTIVKEDDQALTSKKPITSNVDTTISTPSRSRSGRHNAPRISYRTGANLVEDNTSNNKEENKDEKKKAASIKESLPGVQTTKSRKRSKAKVSSNSASTSSTSSPEPKKMTEDDSVEKERNDPNLTDYSDDFEVISPSNSPKR